MIAMTLAEVVEATGGMLHHADPAVLVSVVSTDSRSVKPGDLFVALVGPTHDGHDHVAEALASGAVVALVSQPMGVPSVVVADTMVALGRLARAQLDRLPACTVVAITGSSGKTSTKDLVAAVLADAAETIAPPGSFNNEVGLPVTALRADEDTRFLVMEMGMRGRGHIRYLCDIAPPQVAVVTNVGSAHLELLGSREAIADAKAEVVQALAPTGVAILNHDDPLVLSMRRHTEAGVLTFGESEASDVRAQAVVLDALARASFVVVHAGQEAAVRLRVHGRHQVSNALAAAAVGVAVGLPLERVAEVLSSSEPASRWRMEVARSERGTIVVNDAYNANPESVAAALEALAAMAASIPEGARTWVVLGEMREIGHTSAAEHRQVGLMVGHLGVSRLVVVGEGARPAYESALAELGAERATWVPNAEAAVALLAGVAGVAGVGPDDIVLVKASRSIGLERVAMALLEPASDKDGES